MIEPMSRPPAPAPAAPPPTSTPMICAPPPTNPAIVLSIVPKSYGFHAASATLPPTPPAIHWSMSPISPPHMASSLPRGGALGRQKVLTDFSAPRNQPEFPGCVSV